MFKGLAELGIWPFTWIYYRKISLPKPEKLVPKFELPETLSDGKYLYNPDFYATAETAKAILGRFNALVAFQKPVLDGDRHAPSQWFVRFTDGLEVNAGQLAKFFAQFPEDIYDGIAPRFGLSLIAHERGMKMAKAMQERGE